MVRFIGGNADPCGTKSVYTVRLCTHVYYTYCTGVHRYGIECLAFKRSWRVIHSRPRTSQRSLKSWVVAGRGRAWCSGSFALLYQISSGQFSLSMLSRLRWFRRQFGEQFAGNEWYSRCGIFGKSENRWEVYGNAKGCLAVGIGTKEGSFGSFFTKIVMH